jgi:hypothetical protein
MCTGGDNIFQVKTDIVVLDTQDEVLTQYIETQSPVNIQLEGRILNVNGTSSIQPVPNPTETSSEGAGSPTQTPSAGSLTRGSVSNLALIGAFVMCIMGLASF